MQKTSFFKSHLYTIVSVSLLAIAAILFFAFSNARLGSTSRAHAQSSSEILAGWVWSDTTGWMSFSNDTDGSSPTYNVAVDSSGNMSGYAWSDSIGWISFNPSDVTGCPVPVSSSCSPKINLTTGQVVGWARALAAVGRSDGWDGWIQLSGTNHTSPDTSGNSGVTYNPSNNIVNGYAWGEDSNGNVVGWINFGSTVNSGGSVGGLVLEIPPVITQHTLLVEETGTGSGSVSDGASLTCPSVCSANYNAGKDVTLNATPTDGSTFDGWSNACTGTGSCSVTMSSDEIAAASFTQPDVADQVTITQASSTVPANTPDTFDFSASDPGNEGISYGVVFQAGTQSCSDMPSDVTVPSSGYAASGTTQTFTKSWSANGDETVCIQATTSGGFKSAWTQFIVHVGPAPTNYQEF